jgi:glucose-fructose oxidoreductase
MAKRRVRYAVVGLGYFAQKAILPAFANAGKNSQLVALVSGDPRKIKKLAKVYDVDRSVGYDDFDALCASGDIDAVYVAVPNHKHREYTERAARHGVHVLVEKPMAVSEEDCEAMIAACRHGQARLMIAYRLHFEESSLRALDLVRRGKLGEPRFLSSAFSFQIAEGNVRLNPASEGGGALYDIGVYCINAARTLFGAEPTEVSALAARGSDERFGAVDEQYTVSLRFPGDRLASFAVGFGAAASDALEIVGTKGALRLEPAFSYGGPRVQRLTGGDKVKTKKFKPRDQIAAELLYFSDCVLNGREPEPAGDEGLADVRVVRAALRSLAEKKPITLQAPPRPQHPQPQQKRSVKASDGEAPTVGVRPES